MADINFIGDSYDNGNMVMITVPAGVNVLKLYIQRADNKFDTLLLGVQPSKMYMIQRMDTADGNNNLRLVCNTQSGQVDIYQGHAATDAEHALMIHSPLQFLVFSSDRKRNSGRNGGTVRVERKCKKWLITYIGIFMAV